ncbi:MAG: prephenate dehydrogenase [Betaproteobacteria bacterium RIFCSPLOWO2_02_67_12]|nr:MAG: prephenate dehydrogenase [Betaproteobacteria bacterium RIFCSPLOWO2_02_67_12]OGA27071.1 MAG: prephenate dehydrogenase [Betaproteobacteria bacterium RIFCSPLOWO2_02_FULL_68_150]
MMPFERVAVIGVGLIGGSFALALKAAGLARRVVGAGRSQANLDLALERGVIDAVASSAAHAAQDAELVLVATPVAQYPQVFGAIGPVLGAQAVVTDAGSTKQDVIAAARAGLGARLAQFVPAHPVAGAEHSGAAAATADLFRGKRVVLTPQAETSPQALARVEQAWQACGARLFRMAPEEHDAVFAAVSHLPHLLAYALVHDIAERGNAAQLFGYAASGFRDFTRIASSQPEMWRDICVANRQVLLAELDRYGAQLAALRPMIERGDGAALERVFAAARAARERWLKGDYEP